MIPKVIERSLFSRIRANLFKGKAVIVLGPRQTGKTTLLRQLTIHDSPPLWLNCDDPSVREALHNASLGRLRNIIGTHKLVVIDEAQRVKNIGLTLKLITDEMKDVQLLVSGSSVLEVANEINEPLTGRKWEYLLFPISWEELIQTYGPLDIHAQLEQRILYGMYPEVVNESMNPREVLTQLAGSYLYKDLLSLKGIRKPELLDKLLRALALQIGQEVSYNELASLLQVDKGTVMDYIQLLEQTFIITRLQPLSRNIRSEISTTRKIYFLDTGIRNTLIGNFNPLSQRNDTGSLWENFLIVERLKFLNYHSMYGNRYFWRTKGQQEIDYVEERDGTFYAYEFKWSVRRPHRFPITFTQGYPESRLQVVTPETFHSFVMPE